MCVCVYTAHLLQSPNHSYWAPTHVMRRTTMLIYRMENWFQSILRWLIKLYKLHELVTLNYIALHYIYITYWIACYCVVNLIDEMGHFNGLLQQTSQKPTNYILNIWVGCNEKWLDTMHSLTHTHTHERTDTHGHVV